MAVYTYNIKCHMLLAYIMPMGSHRCPPDNWKTGYITEAKAYLDSPCKLKQDQSRHGLEVPCDSAAGVKGVCRAAAHMMLQPPQQAVAGTLLSSSFGSASSSRCRPMPPFGC